MKKVTLTLIDNKLEIGFEGNVEDYLDLIWILNKGIESVLHEIEVEDVDNDENEDV